MNKPPLSTYEDSTVRMCIRTLESVDATELYFNASPTDAGLNTEDALANIYDAIAGELHARGGQMFAERLILSNDVGFDLVQSARKNLSVDCLPPTVLHAPPQHHQSISGVQVHAIVCDSEISPVIIEDQPVGRRVTINDRSWIHLGALTAPVSETPQAQARAVYRQAAAILAAHDMSFHHVARTWVWLRDILRWYDDFNRARTDLFIELGLVASDGAVSYLPASTGISVAPGNGSAVGLELIAVSDGDRTIENLMSGQNQPSAFSYGSAFARASVAPSPAGTTLFVSGTAAIDDRGYTEHHDDAEAQIDATIDHIRSILHESGVGDDEVLSALAYAKTPEIAESYRIRGAGLPWPRIETIADVCRDDLLFEIELTAAIVHEKREQAT